MDLKAKIDGVDAVAELVARRSIWQLLVDGRYTVKPVADDQGSVAVSVNGRSHFVSRYVHGHDVFIHVDGHFVHVVLPYPTGNVADGPLAAGEIRAEMPGVVVAIPTSAGASVTTGEVLMVIESMKLQTNITAPFDGTVASIHVEPDSTFDRGASLLTIACVPEA